ncbi:enoyl-CoA hydratase/isomerase family protein [Halegenticoccus tardaugens]|uniref:enoyl-CoA hydratase/isomerase family protein n=1 Tax=Halegenticoccus tardaugens TaxID=2071624 RepID=UPI0013E93340|nr:enoyl-CoA hydratase/isomerase family protein [Halegenticoccus tardaugens]
MTDNVTYEADDGVSTIRLERPEKLNAMTTEMWTAVADGVRRADDDDARAVVLTGSGRAFCAGDDIGSLVAIESPRDARELADTVLECFDAIERSPVPVVAKANGSAYGGGFELLISADLTVAPRDTVFGLPETRIGAYPFYGAKRLARLVGRQRAADLALTGRELEAQVAVEWGLFARVVEEEALDDAVAEIVSTLKRSSPASLETTKAWLNASLRFAGEDEAMRNGLGYLFSGPDARKGARAFLENREPDFAE